MNPILEPYYQDQEQKYPKNLEANFSRVMGRILELWGTHELDSYMSELMIDTKGGRQGFPPEVLSELLTLSIVHDKFMAVQDASAQDVWSNEAIRAALDEEHIEYSRKVFSMRSTLEIPALLRYSFRPKSIWKKQIQVDGHL